MDTRTIVTGYEGPDLDGVACSIAYAKLLKNEGVNAVAGTFGEPDREAQFVLDQLGASISSADEVEPWNEVRLVDASDLRGISDEIETESITEVIDHREDHDPDDFPAARVQVELVGAAATLIAERYRDADVVPTDDIANLIYAAIISNTLDLRANVTTHRDEEVIAWLERETDISRDIPERMFDHKSDIDSTDLRSVFENEFAKITSSETDVGIIQLEILRLKEFVENNRQEIFETLESVRGDRDLDHIMCMGVDLKGRYDVLLTSSSALQQALRDAFEVSFQDDVAITDDPILRKELIPPLKRNLPRGD